MIFQHQVDEANRKSQRNKLILLVITFIAIISAILFYSGKANPTDGSTINYQYQISKLNAEIKKADNAMPKFSINELNHKLYSDGMLMINSELRSDMLLMTQT